MECSGVGMMMRVPRLLAALQVYGNRVELSVPHSGLRDHVLRKASHCGSWAAQDDRFDAVFVIQVRMHCGYGHVVMVVLHARQTRRKLTLVVIVDVAQCSDAMLGFALQQLLFTQLLAYQVAKGFGAVLVTLFAHQTVEGSGEI